MSADRSGAGATHPVAPSVGTVTVGVQPTYPVHVGAGLLARAADFVTQRRVVIITDDNVGPRYAGTLERSLAAAGRDVTSISVKPGEDSKDISVWSDLLRHMARAGVDREAAVVALGGGVVGDLAGFVAASYLRGVDFYQFPTSLLSMVDASVGGKTGVDLPEGKNLVGAFWQPRAVIADVEVLASLPEREFRQGTVELVKAGYLADPNLASVYLGDWSTATSAALLTENVLAAVRVKADVVAADERESGLRVVLNLGHTLAHALEAATSHRLAHGDAVAHGLVFAALLGRGRGLVDLVADFRRLRSWVAPGPLPALQWSDLAPYLARDKKVVEGRLRFVLLAGVGEPMVVDDVSEDELTAAWSALLELEETRT